MVRGLEALVTRVGVAAHRQDVNVSVPDPGDRLVAEVPHAAAQIRRLACEPRRMFSFNGKLVTRDSKHAGDIDDDD